MGATVRKRFLKEYTVDTTAEAAITCPASKKDLVEVLRAHNPNSSAQERIKLWIVTSGGAAGDNNELDVVRLGPDATINLCSPNKLGSILLEAGDALWAQALDSDDVVNMSAHGWEESV